ncbi:hypothetical protein CBS101457_006782 [Exobasidium rhododendri]|nr:hypothetical protein CBS101457_006782 [Exobasidium rhododendri]
MSSAKSHPVQPLSIARYRQATQSVISTLTQCFPIALGRYDPRAQFSALRGDASLNILKSALPESGVVGFGFQVLGVESRAKDGGAFVTFAYKPDASAIIQSKAMRRQIASNTDLTSEEASTLTLINAHIRPHLKPVHQSLLSPTRLLPTSWLPPPRAHIVLGTPWLEDLARYPSRTIKLSFLEGDSPSEQQLWEMLRPYGRLEKLELDTKNNVATAVYSRMRGATSARNCLYGAAIGGRKVVIDYLPPLHSHKLWAWLSSHPRIVFPILAFFLGSVTYAVFDPIRRWFIRNKVENTFDIKAYPLYTWLKKKTVGLFSSGSGSDQDLDKDDWWERKAASNEIQSWLRESPSTFITISGPRGSGKHQLLQTAIRNSSIKHLTISCEEIAHSYKNEEAALVPAVANEVGYFPVFNWINSLNSLIDLASVGLIGSKAGFSTPTDAQLKQVLSVTAAALSSIKEDTLKAKEKQAKQAEKMRVAKEKKGSDAGKSASIQSTVSNVPQSVSRNEKAEETTTGNKESVVTKEIAPVNSRDELGPEADFIVANAATTPNSDKDERGYDAPVVIIDGFHLKGVKSDLLWTVLGDWAAELTTSNIAHVVFVSDNPVGMGKTLSRSLPNLPFQTIVLADADEDRARGYVYAKLKQLGKLAEETDTSQTSHQSSGILSMLTPGKTGSEAPAASTSLDEARIGKLNKDTAKWVDLLGGRLTDLENLVQKVSLGQSVENAVKDIIARTVVEIRKNTFGDDLDDAKALPWTRGQAWTVVDLLVKQKGELPYYSLLHDNLKGDESALKALEQAEIISVRHVEGRPSVIRAGRPVIQEALQNLVSDQVFADTQRYLSNSSSIDSCEKLIRDVEKELRELSETLQLSGNLLKGNQATKDRVDYLLEKMAENQGKIRALDSKNAKLKTSLANDR